MLFENGVNVQPSYYNNGEVDFAWGLMKRRPKIRTVRIEIEPGKALQARGWIQQACGNGYEVIATYHKYAAPLGTDNRGELRAAAIWWAKQYANLISAPALYTVRARDDLSAIAAKYYGDPSKAAVIVKANRLTSPNSLRLGQPLTIPARSRSFTINIMNEWGSHGITAREFADGYNAAIGTIRGVYSGPLIIDVPGYGQETAVAASAVKGFNTGGVGILDTNIVVSIHIYREAFVQEKRDRRLEALRHDAHLLAQMQPHPSIVSVYTWRRAGDKHYLVLQYVPGESLEERLKRSVPRSICATRATLSAEKSLQPCWAGIGCAPVVRRNSIAARR
jgi:hypothetical protein